MYKVDNQIKNLTLERGFDNIGDVQKEFLDTPNWIIPSIQGLLTLRGAKGGWQFLNLIVYIFSYKAGRYPRFIFVSATCIILLELWLNRPAMQSAFPNPSTDMIPVTMPLKSQSDPAWKMVFAWTDAKWI